MTDILKPRDGRRAYTAGVGEDGKPRARVPVTPGMISNPDRGHEAQQDQRKGNLALDGAPKAHQNVNIHGGMSSQQQAGHGAGGLGHANSPAVNDEPLDINPNPTADLERKSSTQGYAPSYGMKSPNKPGDKLPGSVAFNAAPPVRKPGA